MTVSSQTVETVIASSALDQLEFFFDFPIVNADDILVVKDEIAENSSLYTVVYTVGNQGGSIIYGIAPDEASEIIISRHTAIDQDLAYPVGNPFPSRSHEGALDKLTMILQEVFIRGVLNRSKSISIELPVDGDNVTLFYATSIVTVSELVSIVSGITPSQDWSIHFGPDRDAGGTEIINGGSTASTTDVGLVEDVFDNAIIPANSWVWLALSAQSGTTNRFHVTMTYSQN
jgi:hypothetical protein